MELRLKVKVMELDGRRFMVAAANMNLATDKLAVVVMRDDDTRVVPMSVEQYNALAYHWFRDEGPAPKGPIWPQ